MHCVALGGTEVHGWVGAWMDALMGGEQTRRWGGGAGSALVVVWSGLIGLQLEVRVDWREAWGG